MIIHHPSASLRAGYDTEETELFRVFCRDLRASVVNFYSSGLGIFDSMSMSRNSLDSKISRQSRHSTYSASSSRETTWTRGWRHGWSMDSLYKRLEVLRAGWLMFMLMPLP